MTNRRGRPKLGEEHHKATRRRAHKVAHWRSKRSYFEAVLIANKLWQPPKVDRT